MKIALASDHAGYELKTGVSEYLSQRGVEVKDFGCFSTDRVNYVDYAIKAMEGLVSGECDRAILVCGAGLGMAIVANKYPGVRAAPCCDEYTAEMSRSHNDANCLTLGGRILPLDEALHIVKIWLETDFEGGRHQERLDKIKSLERKNFFRESEE
jgi:RpiB/LacA/LacB family sugar-phosphate isomerase